MDVFISWSGKPSQEAAAIIAQWIEDLIQAVRAYVSTDDIAKGTRWPIELSGKLESHSVGILCLTPGNLVAPWINFEAGALSKALGTARVMPLLLGVDRSAVPWPLAQFQATAFERTDMLRLAQAINTAGTEQLISDSNLQRYFDRDWDALEASIKPIIELAGKAEGGEKSPAKRPFDQNAVMSETLELVRRLATMASESAASYSAWVHPNTPDLVSLFKYLDHRVRVNKDEKSFLDDYVIFAEKIQTLLRTILGHSPETARLADQIGRLRVSPRGATLRERIQSSRTLDDIGTEANQ